MKNVWICGSVEIRSKNNVFVYLINSTTGYNKLLQFIKDWHKEHNNSYKVCEICHKNTLSFDYMYIINKLKKAGLLDKDYKLRCCYCYSIRNSLTEVQTAIDELLLFINNRKW